MNNIDLKSKPRIDHEFLQLNKNTYPKKTTHQLHIESKLTETLHTCPHLDHETTYLKTIGKLPKDT